MKCLAIIPAREGSKRIPHKNRRPFYGKPIISYSVEAARETGLFDAIYISTDDPELIRLATEWNCYIHLRSNPYLCGDKAGTQEVARDCLLHATGGQYIYVCVIYPTAPLMRAADIVTGYNLITSPGVRYAFAMGEHPPRDAGQFYWGRCEAFMSQAPLLGSWTRIVRVHEKRICDINVPDDWERAERMYAEVHGERPTY